MSTGVDGGSMAHDSEGHRPNEWGSGSAEALIRFRYKGIWYMVAGLFLVSAVVAPASLRSTSLLAVMPFVAFLAIAAMGEALVVMVGGLDLSIPAVIGVVAVTLVAMSGDSGSSAAIAVACAIGLAALIGLANGVLVSVFRLNVLLVTLSVNTMGTGALLLYFQTMRFESRVAPALEKFGAIRLLGLNISVYTALGLVLLLTFLLNFTSLGRRLRAAGANPTASWLAGISVVRLQIGTYVVAAMLYAVAGVLLSAFTVTPNKDAGLPYLLLPIVAVVLGSGSLAGGASSMVATFGGSLFLIQLSQMLKTMGASGYVEYILTGLALGGGMAITRVPLRGLLSGMPGASRLSRLAGPGRR